MTIKVKSLLPLVLLLCYTAPLTANPFIFSGNKKKGTNSPAIQKTIPEKRGWLMDILVRYQQSLNSSISAKLKGLEKDGSFSTFLVVLSIAFLYGILHALSPGHGKMMFSGWVVHSRKKFSKIVLTSIAGTFAHTLSATLLVLIGWLVLKQVVNTEGELRWWLGITAGTTMLLVGLYTIYRHIHSLKNPEEQHHRRIRSGFIVFIMGLMPCPLSTMIMLFSISLGLIWQGLIVVLFFSLGMAVTFLILGLLVWILRERILSIERSRLLWNLNNVLPVLVSLFFIFTGISLYMQ